MCKCVEPCKCDNSLVDYRPRLEKDVCPVHILSRNYKRTSGLWMERNKWQMGWLWAYTLNVDRASFVDNERT